MSGDDLAAVSSGADDVSEAEGEMSPAVGEMPDDGTVPPSGALQPDPTGLGALA
jgi:hypothetical protein